MQPTPEGQPPYCGWTGVLCKRVFNLCSGPQRATGVWGVQALDLSVNGVNGSLSDPQLLASLGNLTACGLQDLLIRASNITGSISPVFGSFTGLRKLALRQVRSHGAERAWGCGLQETLRPTAGSSGNRSTAGSSGHRPAALCSVRRSWWQA